MVSMSTKTNEQQAAGRKYMANTRVGGKTLRNGLNLVQGLIQDISWENGQHKKTPSRQPDEQQFFLYLYITRITIKNNAPHLKSPKNQNRRASLGRPAMKLLGASTSLRSTRLFNELFKKKFDMISATAWQKMSLFIFPNYKSMGNLSCI